MKIEAGKYYKTRDGRKVGPMKPPITASIGYDFWGLCESEDKSRVYQSDGTHGSDFVSREESCDLIAEWTDTPAEPKLWRDMTPSEKGALLLAHHEGKAIECAPEGDDSIWRAASHPQWFGDFSYRVKPADPVLEAVTLYAGVHYGEWVASPVKMTPDKYLMTFKLIDGKPDCDSIRMEAIE